MKKYLKLLRVKHWIKNFLIFTPTICAKQINLPNIIALLIAFIAFSFMTSFVYIINDLKDIQLDKLHPEKRNRPLASGQIKKKNAIIIGILLLILSIILNYLNNNSFFNPPFYILIAYLIINLLYSFGLKTVAVLDIILLASGFVLRIYYGAFTTTIIVSNWLFLTVMSASLFLGLGKRKKEFCHNKNSRKVLTEYNENFLDKFQYLMLGLTLVFYSLWTIEQNNKYLIFTIPLLIIIFMKYSLNIEKNDDGDPTNILYKDKLLFLYCIIYGIIMISLFLLF